MTVTREVERLAGIRPHLGKLEAWSAAGGTAPPGLHALCPTAWRGHLPDHLNGITVLGAPLGHPEFVKAHTEQRLQEEETLLEELPSEAYARGHDDLVRACVSRLLEQPRPFGRNSKAWRIASLPLRLGGAGLRSAERTAPAAYWAAWADALEMLHARQPQWATRFCNELQHEEPEAECLREAASAGRLLDEEGWQERPSWQHLLAGARPRSARAVTETEEEEDNAAEPGEWRPGWQFSASSIREHRYREHTLMPILSPDGQALLRSASGPGAGCWLTALPTSAGTSLRPELFQVALRRRLRLRLFLGVQRCQGRRYGKALDRLGDHLTACPRTGLLQRRAKPLERAWTQVLYEAGGRVVPQQMLRDMDVSLQRADDGRRLDVVAYGLRLFGGVPVCGDATMVSPLHCDGSVRRGADTTNGCCLRAARRRKEVVYPEFVGGDQGRLILLGCEVGGRWAPEALTLLRCLARARCLSAPALLRKSASYAWHRRWLCLVSIAAQSALAASLAEPAALLTAAAPEEEPSLEEVLGSCRMPPAQSRLPLR